MKNNKNEFKLKNPDSFDIPIVNLKAGIHTISGKIYSLKNIREIKKYIVYHNYTLSDMYKNQFHQSICFRTGAIIMDELKSLCGSTITKEIKNENTFSTI